MTAFIRAATRRNNLLDELRRTVGARFSMTIVQGRCPWLHYVRTFGAYVDSLARLTTDSIHFTGKCYYRNN